MKAYFEIRETKSKRDKKTGKEIKPQYYFVLKAANSKIVARSEEYITYSSAEKGIRAVITATEIAATTPIRDITLKAVSKRRNIIGPLFSRIKLTSNK